MIICLWRHHHNQSHCESSPGSFDECRLIAGWPPSDQANRLQRLGLRVRRKLTATINIHHRHCYYYSSRKLILSLPSHEGWKAEST